MIVRFVKGAAMDAPKFDINRKQEYVKYGADNLLPKRLLDLSIQSSLHTAILDKKIKMVIGEGFTYDGPINKRTDDFINKANPNESLNDILLKASSDLEVFGGFSLNIIWSKDKTQIAEIYHVPFQNVRSGKMNNENYVDYYLYNNEWKYSTTIAQCEMLPVFGLDNREQKQLLYAKKYTPTNFYYPLPAYYGAFNDINTLNEISIFHNACIKNNFQPGILIIFRGPTPTPEEQDALMSALEEKYKSAENAGTPAVFWIEGQPDGKNEPIIEQIPISDLDKQYTTLTEAIKESIVMGHEIPRILAGLEKSGSLGGGKEYLDAQMVFYNDYIKPNQNFILSYFNKIAKINGLKELTIKNLKPNLLMFDSNLLLKVLTTNEIRNLLGLDDLEDKNNLNNE